VLESLVAVRLDVGDKVVFASEDWLPFAGGDNRPLTEGQVLGRPFSEFAPDRAFVPLYELVFRRVRRTRQAIRVPFTYDSNDERRHMEMEVLPLEGGGLECRYHTLLVQRQGSEANSKRAQGQELLTLCSWCKKVRLPEGHWVEVDTAAQRLEFFLGEAPQLTHGICPPCRLALLGSFAPARQK
jgi:hypothetical protein